MCGILTYTKLLLCTTFFSMHVDGINCQHFNLDMPHTDMNIVSVRKHVWMHAFMCNFSGIL